MHAKYAWWSQGTAGFVLLPHLHVLPINLMLAVLREATPFFWILLLIIYCCVTNYPDILFFLYLTDSEHGLAECVQLKIFQEIVTKLLDKTRLQFHQMSGWGRPKSELIQLVICPALVLHDTDLLTKLFHDTATDCFQINRGGGWNPLLSCIPFVVIIQ